MKFQSIMLEYLSQVRHHSSAHEHLIRQCDIPSSISYPSFSLPFGHLHLLHKHHKLILGLLPGCKSLKSLISLFELLTDACQLLIIGLEWMRLDDIRSMWELHISINESSTQ